MHLLGSSWSVLCHKIFTVWVIESALQSSALWTIQISNYKNWCFCEKAITALCNKAKVDYLLAFSTRSFIWPWFLENIFSWFTDVIQHKYDLIVVLLESVCLCHIWQDLKNEKVKAKMGAARAVLEKSTMMLLTSCKVRRQLTFRYLLTRYV